MTSRSPEEQLNLYDRKASARARDASIAQVELATGAWQVDALATIRSVAQHQESLTTDDVWKALGRKPELEGRAMGAAMRSAAKLGLILKTDRTRKSERVACHRRDLRIWTSLIYGKDT